MSIFSFPSSNCGKCPINTQQLFIIIMVAILPKPQNKHPGSTSCAERLCDAAIDAVDCGEMDTATVLTSLLGLFGCIIEKHFHDNQLRSEILTCALE